MPIVLTVSAFVLFGVQRLPALLLQKLAEKFGKKILVTY